jgi:phosphatidylglycerol:prolipoprotein diacylglycerol transferase
MLPVIHLGPLAIQTPGLIILFGLWIGMWIIEHQAERYQANGGVLSNLVFIGLITGVVGARLAFVVHYSFAFITNPASLFSLNLSLFDPAWGLLVGFIAACLYGWRKRIPVLPSLDALTGGLAAFMIFYYLAQLASGDGYGSPTSLPWAIDLRGTYRHPVQIYEMIAAYGIYWLVWPNPTRFRTSGQRFVAFIALSASARLFLEAFHGDSVLWGNFRSAQVIAWLVLAASLWAARQLKKAETVE